MLNHGVDTIKVAGFVGGSCSSFFAIPFERERLDYSIISVEKKGYLSQIETGLSRESFVKAPESSAGGIPETLAITFIW